MDVLLLVAILLMAGIVVSLTNDLLWSFRVLNAQLKKMPIPTRPFLSVAIFPLPFGLAVVYALFLSMSPAGDRIIEIVPSTLTSIGGRSLVLYVTALLGIFLAIVLTRPFVDRSL
jgi:hypothetical protein